MADLQYLFLNFCFTEKYCLEDMHRYTFANKTDDKSRKMVDRIPTGGVMSAMQNITAPEEGGELHALSSSSQKTVSSHTQSQPDPAS